MRDENERGRGGVKLKPTKILTERHGDTGTQTQEKKPKPCPTKPKHASRPVKTVTVEIKSHVKSKSMSTSSVTSDAAAVPPGASFSNQQ